MAEKKILQTSIYAELSSAPDTPPSSFRKLYPKSDGWYALNSAGDELRLLAVDGSGIIEPDQDLGFGVAPTARVHIGAGTTDKAALKLTSGSLLTAEEDGAFEYDGNTLYFTIGSTRRDVLLGGASTTTISDLSDVDTTGASDDSTLRFDSSNGEWNVGSWAMGENPNGAFYPLIDDSQDLGTASNRVRDIYVGSTVDFATSLDFDQNTTNVGSFDSGGDFNVANSQTIGAPASPAARLHVKGSGNSSATDSFVVDNSDDNTILTVRDDQTVGIGEVPSTFARLRVKGFGTTSSTNSFFVEDGSGNDMLRIRDDGAIAIGVSVADNHRLLMRGLGNSSTTTSLLIEDSVGGDLFQVRDDGLLLATSLSISTIDSAGGKVLTTKEWVQAQGISASILSPNDKAMTALATSIDGDKATNDTITNTPVNGCYVAVFINGQEYEVGDGVKTKPAYFSGDGGTSARGFLSTHPNGQVQAGDELYWNGSIAGVELSSGWRISLMYVTN